MTLPCRSCKAAILQVDYTGQEKKTIGKKRTTTTRTHWNHGQQNGTTPIDTTTKLIPRKQTGPRTTTRLTITIPTTAPSPITILHSWTTLSKHKKETRANLRLGADTSRRTWTQARQLMKDVHRSRGYFPVSNDNMMEVDQGKGKSRGKKERSSKGKGKRQGKSEGKGKERRL